MSKLQNQLSEIDKELEILCAGDEIRVVIEELESSVDELAPECEALEQAFIERAVLIEHPNTFQIDDVAGSEELPMESSRECFSTLLSFWDESPASIRQNGSVGRFRDAVAAYRKSVSANNGLIWCDNKSCIFTHQSRNTTDFLRLNPGCTSINIRACPNGHNNLFH